MAHAQQRRSPGKHHDPALAAAPELNPVEGMWAHIKRSLANLAARTLSNLETLLRRRLKELQYRRALLDGFLAGTGLTLDRPDRPYDAEVSKRQA